MSAMRRSTTRDCAPRNTGSLLLRDEVMMTEEAPGDRAAHAFSEALARWRDERGLTKKQLAKQMSFDPSYISHVEAARHRPTEDFARRADAALRAGGALWQLFREYDDARSAAGHIRPRTPHPIPEQRGPQPSQASSVVVERELA